MAQPIQYQRIPTLQEWKKQSSVRLARRSKDPVLKRIDSIIEAFGLVGDQGARAVLGGDLFFALDFWLKNKRNGEKGREPAIQALYSHVAHWLASTYNVTINVLPRELELNYGRTMSDHGTKLDRDWQCADYLTRAEALKYALRWKKGKAYMFPHWEASAGPNSKVVLANSSRMSNPDVNIPEGYGGFAMSMSQTIYMARHHCTKGQFAEGNHYHSSYLGGESVLCAGTLKIVKGIVYAVRTNSGHYRPTDEHMLAVINLLRTVGAPIDQLDVESHDGTFCAKAPQFVAAGASWRSLLQRREANLRTLNERAAGTANRIDGFLYDLAEYRGNFFQTDQHFYDYICRTYGWTADHAYHRLQRAYQRVGAHRPAQGMTLQMAKNPPGKPH